MGIPTLTSSQIETFILIFVRITAIISLLPIFGSQSVPAQLKAGLSFVLAMVVFPSVSPYLVVAGEFNVPIFFVTVIKEALIGIAIGYVTTFMFAAVQFAGRLIDTQMGFALVQVIDPFSNTQTTVTGQFQVLLFSIIFLLVNGHYFLLLAAVKSFEMIPLTMVHFPSGAMVALFTRMTGNIFVMAVRFASPVFSVLVLSSLSLGIVARTVPQINIFFVGLPMKIGLGIVSLIIVLPSLVNLFRVMTNSLMEDIWRVLFLMS